MTEDSDACTVLTLVAGGPFRLKDAANGFFLDDGTAFFHVSHSGQPRSTMCACAP